MSNTLTRAKIAEIMSSRVGLSKEDALEIIEDIIDEIGSILATEKMLTISSFGTFRVCKKRARIGRIPKTSTEVLIEEHNVILFRPSDIVKNLINNKRNV